MAATPKVAYDVTVIHDCIVRDTEIARQFKTKAKKMALYREKQKLLDRHPEVKQMIDPAFVQSLDEKRGQYVAKVDWLPTALVISDPRIREMCRNMFTLPKAYTEATGISFGPCPGHGKMSACPPYSFTAQEAREKLDQADIFIAIQSKSFLEPPEHRGWQDQIVNKYRKAVKTLRVKRRLPLHLAPGPASSVTPIRAWGQASAACPSTASLRWNPAAYR